LDGIIITTNFVTDSLLPRGIIIFIVTGCFERIKAENDKEISKFGVGETNSRRLKKIGRRI